MTDSNIRVRFPPSPTGYLHVGSVRTALFNWLYARHNGGAFVFRIEDTDESRHIEDAVEQIQRSLRWVGIDWDEGVGVGGPHGPYIQSERRAEHQAAAEKLLAEGHLYRCYCSSEELARDREAAQAAGRPVIYSGRCRELDDEQRAALEAEGRRPALRLRAPEHGDTVWEDLVRGEIRILNATVGDHIVVRSDGIPTYNFVNPLDDAAMEINTVIRGEDLLPSTPRQIHLYQAIGAPIPRFGHLPMVLGADRKRLSKRHGATSVEEFRDAGYLPEAVINGLALVGWSLDDSHELFSRAELVEHFTHRAGQPGAGRVRPPEARAPERPAHPGALGGRAGPADPGLPRGARTRRSPRSPTWCARRPRWCRRRSRRWPSSSRTARSCSGTSPTTRRPGNGWPATSARPASSTPPARPSAHWTAGRPRRSRARCAASASGSSSSRGWPSGRSGSR